MLFSQIQSRAYRTACLDLGQTDLPFNTLMLIQTKQADSEFTIQVMRYFRQVFGQRAVVANEDLNNPIGRRLRPVYDEFQTLYV